MINPVNSKIIQGIIVITLVSLVIILRLSVAMVLNDNPRIIENVFSL